MNTIEISKIIEESIVNKNHIKIQRSKIVEEDISAIPIKASEQLLLFKYIVDFKYDGYKVIQLKDISSIRSGEIERFHEQIFEKENLNITNIDELKDIIITDWEMLFNSLYNNIEIIEIECEKNSDGFYLGKICSIEKESITFLEMDLLGQWDKEPCIINYKDITVVNFKDRYSTILCKYQQLSNN